MSHANLSTENIRGLQKIALIVKVENQTWNVNIFYKMLMDMVVKMDLSNDKGYHVEHQHIRKRSFVGRWYKKKKKKYRKLKGKDSILRSIMNYNGTQAGKETGFIGFICKRRKINMEKIRLYNILGLNRYEDITNFIILSF